MREGWDVGGMEGAGRGFVVRKNWHVLLYGRMWEAWEEGDTQQLIDSVRGRRLYFVERKL